MEVEMLALRSGETMELKSIVVLVARQCALYLSRCISVFLTHISAFFVY